MFEDRGCCCRHHGAIAVVAGGASGVGVVSRDRSRARLSVECLKFGFLVKKFLMNLWKRRGRIATINLICHGLVLFGEAIKDVLNLILMVKCLSKQGEFIETSCQALKVFID